jgi:hypothetical protein
MQVLTLDTPKGIGCSYAGIAVSTRGVRYQFWRSRRHKIVSAFKETVPGAVWTQVKAPKILEAVVSRAIRQHHNGKPFAPTQPGSCGVLPILKGEFLVRRSYWDRLFLHCLDRALRDYGVTPPRHLLLPRSISRVVKYDRVKTMIANCVFCDDETAEEQHRATVTSICTKSRSALMQQSHVGCNDPFIWRVS